MADRYVNYDKLLEERHRLGLDEMSKIHKVNAFNQFIDHLPTADVEEVKHGEWKEHFAFDCWHYDCPFCDDGYATKEKDKTPPNYCGNCGAKMDGQ